MGHPQLARGRVRGEAGPYPLLNFSRTPLALPTCFWMLLLLEQGLRQHLPWGVVGVASPVALETAPGATPAG